MGKGGENEKGDKRQRK